MPLTDGHQANLKCHERLLKPAKDDIIESYHETCP